MLAESTCMLQELHAMVDAVGCQAHLAGLENAGSKTRLCML
jgi:hypothetical protein